MPSKRTTRSKKPSTALPQSKSVGEETFALQCQAYKLQPQREVELIPERKFRFDFYFREKDLAVEIEGGTSFGKSRHSRGEGFINDCRKYNAAALAGIKLLRFTTAMVESGEAIDTVRSILRPPVEGETVTQTKP